ncbi:protein phosphatase 1 regulatory subunit 15A [Pontoporia blainvillei]|uniref:Protein phosphatase 1 regulatory subunit 15A n=1 Tax=Pontoporia blainvillei TaxID=48723 RepID=A0ABX0SB66_PONBL|nr:protein phosphatase 1 regulatory subunit 15A [Pontoporia blainvillei]
MAPGQVPHQPAPWRDTHPFYLVSPLVGLLSWAWRHLRGPRSPEPWLVEAVTGTDQGEAGPEGEAKASLATHRAPKGRHPQEETGDSGAAQKDGETSRGACPDLETKCFLLEAWGLSDDDDEEYGREEATSIPREQGSEFMDGQPAPLCPSLQVASLQDPPGEEDSKEEGIAEDKEVITFSCPPSRWECCPGLEEEAEDGAAVNEEAPGTSASPSALGSKPRAWVCCPVDGATEEERTENKAAMKTSSCPSSAGSHLRAWECCSGEEPEEEKPKKAERGEADPEPHSPVPAQSPPLRTRRHQSSEITEEEEEEEDSDSGEAEASSSIPPTSAFLRAWVYRPGEDTEEETECEGENEDEDGESGATDLEPSPSLQAQSALFRDRMYQPGEETEGGEAATEWGEAEPCPFRVAIYLPGEKAPPPRAPPPLPLRLQTRLKSAETPTRHRDPEPPLKTRKVGAEGSGS